LRPATTIKAVGDQVGQERNLIFDGNLTAAEVKLRRGIADGGEVDLQVGQIDLDDPARGSDWGRDRVVRAALLMEALIRPSTIDRRSDRPRVHLRGARVTGALNLQGARLDGALSLTDCSIAEPVNLAEAEIPAIRLRRCHLPSLNASQLTTRGDFDLSACHARYLGLLDARIGGSLVLDGAHLDNDAETVVNGSGLRVAGWMSCDDGFTTRGQIRLIGADIRQALSFTGAHLSHPGGYAVNAQAIHIGYALFLGSTLQDPSPLTIEGGVRINGATIDNFLCGWNVTINRPDGCALLAEGLAVGGGIAFERNFTVNGEVYLSNARIGTLVDLTGASLRNPGGPALTAERIEIGRTLRLTGAIVDGSVNLTRGTIGSEVDLSRAEFAGASDHLSLVGAQTPSLNLTPRKPPEVVDLRHARLGLLTDDPASWSNTIRLGDLTYDSLAENPTHGLKTRLRWLARDIDRYVPQPYEQLAANYRRSGHEDAAKRVAIARQARQRVALGPIGRCWNWMLYLTVGYGYRTWQAGLWLIALTAVGAGVFTTEFPTHFLSRTSPAPAFQPAAYAVDVLIPIANLGQQEAWQPIGAALYWTWGLTAAGWILTTAVAAGLTSVLKRD
jgi:hypothetical protein